MNIQQFQYVLAIVDSKNFELAAESCFITQSNLSNMVRRFEDEIGIKIFNRKTRPVSITIEGKEVINKLRIVIRKVESLKSVIQEIKDEMIGELKIGVIPTIAPHLLPLFLSKFTNQFPSVKVVVKEIPTAEIRESLKNKTLDIGLLAIPIEDSELVEQELYSEPFLVYDCRDYEKTSKISINDVDYSKLWLLQEGHCLRTQVCHICEKYNMSPKGSMNFEFEFGSMDSLLHFTKVNKGITIIPYLASLDFSIEEKGNIVEFTNPIPVRSVGLLTHKSFVKKRLANELQKIIQESVALLIPEIEQTEVIKPV